MSLKTILLLIGTGLYFWAGQYWYTCIKHEVCGDEPKENVEITVIEYQEEFGPLTYKFDDHTAYTSPTNFQAFKDSILSGKTDDNILEITGYHFNEEATPTGHKSMGAARAKSARALFSGDLLEERVRIIDLEVDEFENVRTDPFKSVDFKWIVVKVEEAEVVVLSDRAVMLFPLNSVNMIGNPKIDQYFNDVAANIKTSGEKIHLTGHTDNTGNEASNLDLGKRRANAIRAILVAKGVDKSIITIDSKGETQPVATNDTEEGRHQNRRVELRLIKQ